MNPSLSDALAEAYASVPEGQVILETIELSHPQLGGSIYMVQDMVPHDMTLETGQTVTFEPVGFDFKLPAAGENGRQDLSMALDNTDLRITDFLKQARQFKEPCLITYRPYLWPDLSQPQMDPPLQLTLKAAQVSGGTVNGKASFADVLNSAFPNQLYTRSRFPNLGG